MSEPMSDAELDAQEPDAVVALMAAKELEEIGEKSKARAIASALGELARLRMERVQITAMANEFGERCVSLQAAHAAAQRRDTERDAELAAAVADNAALLLENPCACDIDPGVVCDLHKNHPGAAWLREHERRGAVVEAARFQRLRWHSETCRCVLCSALAALDAGDEANHE